MQLVRPKEKKLSVAQEFAKILVGKWRYENSVKALKEIKALKEQQKIINKI